MKSIFSFLLMYQIRVEKIGNNVPDAAILAAIEGGPPLPLPLPVPPLPPPQANVPASPPSREGSSMY